MKTHFPIFNLCLLALTIPTSQTQAMQTSNLRGHVVADQIVRIKNRTSTSKVIVYLIKEGSKVRKGDLIAELDSAELQEKLNMAKVNIKVAKSQLIEAENDLATAKLSLDSTKKKYESELELLDSELETLFAKNGKFALQQESFESTVIVEQARTSFLKKKLEPYQDQKPKDGVAYLELKFQLADSQAKSRVAMKSLEFLKDVAMKQERRKIEIQRGNIQLKMVAAIHESESKLNTARSEVAAKKLALDLDLEAMNQTQQELRNCVIHAPQDGVVYYSQSDRSDFIIEEGVTLRSSQVFAYLPNLDSLSVEVMVPESIIDSLKKGQTAFLSVEGDESGLEGQIRFITTFPVPASRSKNGTKSYKVLVRIKNPKNLKIGQSVSVKIKH